MPQRIACIWEAGAGLGHLTRLQPIVKHAVNAGHEVFLVAKELANIHSVFAGYDLHLLQAPYDTTPPAKLLPLSWPETLLLRYRSPERLANYLTAWTTLFELIKPDLIVYDASPTAFIASSHLAVQKWAVGSPFFMPRSDAACVGVFPNAKQDASTVERLQKSEWNLLKLMNHALKANDLPAQHRSLKKFLEVIDVQLITSLPEFDYFGKRRIGEYVGMPASLDRALATPPWPETDGPKIFGYLKAFPGINQLLDSLERISGSVVVYSQEIPRTIREKHGRIAFIDSPASMDVICREANLIIHMAGSQTVARCLASGLPQLLIPTGLEQLFTAQAAKRLGKVSIANKSKQDFDKSLRDAIANAQTEGIAVRKFETNLLDGSYYDQRVGNLISSL